MTTEQETEIVAKMTVKQTEILMNDCCFEKATGQHTELKERLSQELAELTAALAESKKPKARYGDLRYWPIASQQHYRGLWSITDTSSGEPVQVWIEGAGREIKSGGGAAKIEDSTLVFNLLDHLKALQENVTEFEIAEKDRSTNPVTMKVVNMPFIEGTGVQIRLSGGNPCAYNMSLSELSAYILKMQQLEATMKRKK